MDGLVRGLQPPALQRCPLATDVMRAPSTPLRAARIHEPEGTMCTVAASSARPSVKGTLPEEAPRGSFRRVREHACTAHSEKNKKA